MPLSSRTRNQMRIDLHLKYAEKRLELKKVINMRRTNRNIDLSSHMAKVAALHVLPRNSSKVRIRNRCFITSRPRAYLGYFGICHFQFREMCIKGLIPGIRNASW